MPADPPELTPPADGGDGPRHWRAAAHRFIARTPFLRHFTRGARKRGDQGLGLIETMIALSLMASSVALVSDGIVTSLNVTHKAQYRAVADQIASETIQEVQNLGYATAHEGIDCTIGAGAACAVTDPNHHLHYGSNGHTSTSCWYYGTSSSTSKLLVPTINESALRHGTTVVPIIPYVSGSTADVTYPNPVQNGVTYRVSTYPVFNLTNYPTMSCQALSNGSDPTVPLTVVVEVSWNYHGSYNVEMSGLLYSTGTVTSLELGGGGGGSSTPASNNCQGLVPGAGAHTEALLGFQSTVAPQLSKVTAGGTASILFLDEQPTPTAPAFCVLDATGKRSLVPVRVTSVTYYGSGPTNPFLKDVTTADDTGGSGPNAEEPPTGGSYCQHTYAPPVTFPGPTTDPPTSCDDEIRMTFRVPGNNPYDINPTTGQPAQALSLTLAVWDHEQDLDVYTWKVLPNHTGGTPPLLTRIAPKAGPIAGGNHVLLFGHFFKPGATVKFGATSCTTVVVLTSTTITCVAPAHAAGVVTVLVTTTQGSSQLGVQYTYDPIPTLTKVSPTKGSTLGKTAVTLTGTGFVKGTTSVGFVNTTPTRKSLPGTTIVVVSSTQILLQTPAHVTGQVTVVVTTPGGASPSGFSYTKFTFIPPPTISKITPDAGPTAGGTVVTLTGTRYTSGAKVKFGTTTGTSVTVVSTTKITVKAPAHVTGTVTVVVYTTNGFSNGVKYAYGAPSLTAITPPGGRLAGGTTVTLTGAQFVTGATVTFGSVHIAAATVTVVSPTKLTVKAPGPHTAGTVTVTVSDTVGTSGAVHYTYYTAPTLTSITPTGGKATGGNRVTLHGTHFITGAQVFFGTTAGTTVVVVSTSTITVKAPVHNQGNVTVTVKTYGGTSSGKKYTFYPAPIVTKVTPSAGPIAGGTTVVLTGSGLVSATKVTFGTSTATSFVVNSTLKITATAPAHAKGAVTVIVTTTGGTSNTGEKYAYDAVPTLTKDTPNGGTTAGGTTVTLTGTNFVTGATVSFGGKAGTTVVVVSTTSITVKSPSHTFGVVTLSVTTPGGTTTSVKYVFGSPTVTKITPGAGKTSGGTSVTLTGTGFISGAKVKFGSSTGTTVVVVSPTSITVKIPAHASGTVTVVVHTAGGTSTGVKFYYGAPTLTAVTPNAGSTHGGTGVTLTGTKFAAGAKVIFGASTATTVVVVSSTTITAKIPAHASGTVTVKVTTGGGTSGGVSFTYNAVPILTKVTPGAGKAAGGTTVTLTGNGFLSGSSVKFGTTTANTVVVVSSTKITAKSPAHAAGTVTVTVKDSGGTSNGLAFVFGPPTLTAVTPSAGKIAGGTSVALTGSGFVSGATVSFGLKAATTVTVVNSTTITVKSPTHTHVTGTVSVTVTTPGGTSGGVNYTYDPVPTVTGVTPSTGFVTGGTSVTVNGSGFATPVTVKFGGKSATTVVVVSSTKITAKIPAHSAGTVSVVVTTPGGTATGSFKYVVPVPIITLFTPTQGSTTGGTTVTITGTNFSGTGFSATGVKFGTTLATSFTVTNSTTVKAVTGSHVAGTVTVKVTTAGGTATSLSNFKYVVPAPTITSVSPMTGLTSGGTTVTITGTNFSGQTISLSTVKIGSTAKTVVVVNSTTITAVTKSHAAGTVTVKVTTNGGTATASSDFKFVTPITTTTTLTSSANPSQVAQTVTYTATVAGVPSGTPATGTVTFKTGTTTISCASGSSNYSSGTATCKVKYTSATTGADYSIKALFTSTDRHYQSSTSSAVTQQVDAVPTVTNVATTSSETTTTAVTSSITTTGGASYIIFADHTSSSGDSATLSSTGSLKTIHQITAATNAITVSGAKAGTEPSWQWAWYATGTGSAGTVTATFAKASTKSGNPFNLIQVVKVTGVNVANPVAGAVLTDGKTATKKAAVTLRPSSTTQQLVNLYVGGDMGGAAPAWSSATVTNVASAYQHNGGGTTGDGETTATAVPGLGSATAGSTPGGWPATNTDAYGAVDLQLRLKLTSPTITSFTPATGTTSGGTTVTITGSHFSGPGISITSVKFGTTAATSYSVTSSTTIKAITATHVAGTVTIKVATSGGTATSPGNYKFVAPVPTITTFLPASGPTTGGTTVTITGTGYIGATAIKFGTTAASSFTVTSPTTIKAVTEAHAAGTVQVSVATTGGLGIIAAQKFTYSIPAPTVTSFTPMTGADTGGTTVTITGTGFSGKTISVSSVSIGTTATTVAVVSSTTITAKTKAHSVGTVPVKVITNGGSATAPSDYKFVVPVTTKTTLASSSDPSQVGGTVTYTATVAGVPSGTPTSGSVTFKTATTTITCGSGSTGYSSGTATCKVKYTATSTGRTIKAVFSGGGKYLSSTSTLTQVIDAAPTVTNVSTESTETTTTATSSSFTSTSGASYIIFASHTSSSGDSASLSTTGSLKTIHQITAATNAITVSGATAGTDPSWQWAWYATGTGSAGTTTATFAKASSKTHANPYNLIQVVKVTGVNTANPVIGATLTKGKTSTKKAAVTLSSTGSSEQLVYLYGGGDLSPNAPGWSPSTTVTNVASAYEHSGGPNTGLAEDTATAAPSLGSATAGTGSWPATNGDAYGSVDLQLRLPVLTPTITSFSPSSGPVGGLTTVTITGTNFTDQGLQVTSVKFGTTAAGSYTVTGPTTITAKTQSHVAATVTVKVGISGATATASTDYKFVAAPTITSFTPTTGPTTGGTTVTITGGNFTGASSVMFGTTAALSYSVTSATTIKAKTKPHTAATVQIAVTTTGGVIRSSTDFAFKAVPTITGFTPSTGPASGGTTVTLTGTNFTASSVATFGGSTATLVSYTSSTTIKVLTPAHTAGTVVVKVTTIGGVGTAASDYKYVAAPSIISFTPATGSTTGGTSVTITGTNFSGATSVKFGTTAAASYSVTSPTSIKATTESHVAGTVVVSVTTIGGTAHSSSDFKYLAIPTITSLTPSTGSTSGDTTVVITGTNLTTATVVKFGSTTAASYTITGPTRITAVTKPHPTGTVSVSVTTPVSTAFAPGNFRFIAPTPAVTSFSPTSGTTSGGTSVTITGTGFYGATSVKFGTTTANSFTVTGPTQIKAVSKPHAAGTVTLQVTTPGGTARSSRKFKFTALAPTISSITPTTGSADGGASVTITGTNLYGATSVKFVTKTTITASTTATSFTVSGPTTVVAVTPAHAPGFVTLDVTTAGGTATYSYYVFMVPVPRITSILPATGSVTGGTTVTIKGTGFSGPDFAVSQVTFGTTTAATFTITGETTITATTFPHAAGTVVVNVTDSAGTGASPTDFKFFVPAPTITSFTPSSGPTTGGTTVTIIGTHFTYYGCNTEGCGTKAASAVKFGTTTAASFTVTGATKITAFTGAHQAGTYAVKVTTPGGTGSSLTSFAFLPPQPTITGFSPTIGRAAGGTTVSITGTNFEGARFTTTKVKFGSTTATSFTVTSPTTITAKTKAHAAGDFTISVVTLDQTVTSSSKYLFVATPTITSFAPTAGPTTGGTTVVITGTNFKGTAFTTTSVKFGSTAATSVTVTSSTKITAKTKSHAAGTVKISLVTPGGIATSSTNYTFAPAPTITSFAPTAGPTSGGTTVVITGTNFKGTGFTTTSVKFGSTAATSVTVTSSTKITAKTKPHAAGTVSISLVTPGGTVSSGSSKYTFVSAPTITSFAPTAGPISGGTTVVITGTNFKGTGFTTTSVKFGSTAATSVTVTSSTKITAKTKPHAAGTVSISLVTPGGTVSSGSSKYTFVSAPTITSFAPTAGPISGGTTVVITGTNFKGTGFTTTSVRFGTTTAASFTVTSSTKITATTRAHAAGTVKISVVTPGGTVTSGASTYAFAPAPTISSFSPSTGLTSGGTTVVISGGNFSGSGFTTSAVKFGTTTAFSFTVTSSAKITAKTRAHAAGTVKISVVTPGGTVTSGLSTYAFVPAPTISTFAPTAGTTSGGTTVVIKGTNFKGTGFTTTSVRFGTTTAASFTVTSSTKITATTRAHAAGTVKISVVTPGGTVTSGASTYAFAPAPTISSFSPSTGLTSGGTTVVISGGNFSGSGFTTSAVKFGTTTAFSFTVTSSAKITAKTKAHAAGTFTISVVTPGGTVTSLSKFKFYTQVTLTTKKNELYVAPGTTSVTYTLYGGGGAGGASTGAHTGGAGGAGAKITGKISLSSNPSGEVLTVIVGGGGKASATATGGAGGTCGTGCTDPAAGGNAGKNTTGHHFASGGGGAGSIIQISGGADVVVAAGGAGGGAGVGKNGGAGGKAGIFSSNPASTPASTGSSGASHTSVTSCTNAGGTGGVGGGGSTSGTTPFNATGGCKGLADTGGPATHHKPGTQGQPTSAGAGPGAGGTGGNSPDGPTGAGGGGGWAGGGGAGGSAPNGGSGGGGGSSFYRSTTTVGSIIVTTTALTSANGTGGSFGGGGAAATKGGTGHALFTGLNITSILTPTVSAFSPTAGRSSGGTSVTITGSHFTDVTAVKFGSTAATSYTVTSSTKIVAVTKSHTAGTVTISVTDPVGTGTSSSHYTFVAAPTITTFSPTTGSHTGSTTVVITGANFSGTGVSITSLKFGATAATSYTVTSSTKITAHTEPHASGTVTISVTTNGGTGTSSSSYKFS